MPPLIEIGFFPTPVSQGDINIIIRDALDHGSYLQRVKKKWVLHQQHPLYKNLQSKTIMNILNYSGYYAPVRK